MNTMHLAAITSEAILAAALLTSGVSLVGLWHTARSRLRDRQRQLFAEALSAVAEYREFVYRVRRGPHARERALQLSDELSEVQAQIRLHSARLSVEAPKVATRYEALVLETRHVAGRHIRDAWEDSAAAGGVSLNIDPIDMTALDPAEHRYKNECRRHLRVWPRLGLSRTRPDSPPVEVGFPPVHEESINNTEKEK